jgi:CheY-like chemotaxis protein
MSCLPHNPGVVLCIGNEPVHLNLRCSLLKEHGWYVLSSASGHQGLLRFQTEMAVQAVILDVEMGTDGAESALIAGQLKSMRPSVPVILLVTEGEALVDGALQCADVVVPRSEISKLLEVLNKVRSCSSIDSFDQLGPECTRR